MPRALLPAAIALGGAAPLPAAEAAPPPHARRRRRFRRRLVVGFLVGMIGLVCIAGVLSYGNALKASRSELKATKSERKAIIELSEKILSQASALQQAHQSYAAGALLLRALEVSSSAEQGEDVEILKRRIWQRFRYLDLRPTKFLDGHIEAVQAIDVMHNGKIAATGSGYWQPGLSDVRSQDDTVRLWSLETNQQIAVFEGHRAAVLKVRFDAQGSALVSASQDGAIKIWDMESRTLRCELSVDQFRINIQAVDFSSDGRWILVGTEPYVYEEGGQQS